MEDVIDVEPLYNSMNKCRKGVLWKSSTANFYLNGMEKCLKLSESLKDDSYEPLPPYSFKVLSPKPRDIISIGFRDRVYQRSLNDMVVYPEVCKSFIYDNLACQKDKGTDKVIERFKFFLNKAYKEYGSKLYIAQFDIHGYYPNMNHDVVKKVFKKHLDNVNFERCCGVFDSQYQGNIGFNPGSQLVQIAGISALDNLDHYIKEKLCAKYYLRYMDDFCIISNDIDYLKNCRAKIEKELSDIGFILNDKKTKISKAVNGTMFLGFKFRVTNTGKVIMTLDPNNVKRERRKLFRLVSLYHKGEVRKSKIYECYSSWKDHASKGDSCKVIAQMDRYLKNLWRR